MALGVADDADLGGDVERDVARAPRSRARSSRRRCRSRAAARPALACARAVAPRKVSCASSSPLSVRASSPKRSRTVAANSPPLAASRTAEVITATAVRRAVLRDRRGVLGERCVHALARRLPEPAGGLDALAQPRDERAPLDLGDAGRSTSAISSRVEFEPMSTTATRVNSPGGASARRRAPPAGCRPRSRSCDGACARSRSRRGARRAGSARAAAGGRPAAARAR